jgi:3-oxoacyl-[acyl-carrier protein] reductase
VIEFADIGDEEDGMTDRVAIVTGASGGIGRAVAARLGKDGIAVAVHYAGNRDRAQEAADEITAAGGRAAVARADVADENDVAALVRPGRR